MGRSLASRRPWSTGKGPKAAPPGTAPAAIGSRRSHAAAAPKSGRAAATNAPRRRNARRPIRSVITLGSTLHDHAVVPLGVRLEERPHRRVPLVLRRVVGVLVVAGPVVEDHEQPEVLPVVLCQHVGPLVAGDRVAAHLVAHDLLQGLDVLRLDAHLGAGPVHGCPPSRPSIGGRIKSRTARGKWGAGSSGLQGWRLVTLTPGVGAAVDHDRRARDVAAAVARQEGDRGGDLLSGAGPAHRDLVGERVDHVLAAVLEDPLGLDHARRDADGADTEARPLERDPGGEGFEAAPGHRRRHDLWDPAARAEAEEGDEAGSLRDHPALGDSGSHVPGRVDVQPVDRAEPLERGVLEAGGELTAGVVDQDIDPVGLRRDRVKERADLLGLADVARLLEAPVAKFIGHRRDRLRTSPADRDAPAGRNDGASGRRADPRATTGHDGVAIFECVGGQRRAEPLYHGASMQEGRVIGADGVRLATRTVSGPPDGPAFVLHHGLASSQHIWDLMVPRLARAATVVTFDARGHGESSKPSSGYGFEHTGADAVAVLKATRRKRPILVGHSWGAMVALEVAARKPSAVSGVVLVDGGVGTMRDGFASWTEAREALNPPQLAGTPADAFRAM